MGIKPLLGFAFGVVIDAVRSKSIPALGVGLLLTMVVSMLFEIGIDATVAGLKMHVRLRRHGLLPTNALHPVTSMALAFTRAAPSRSLAEASVPSAEDLESHPKPCISTDWGTIGLRIAA